MRILFVSKNLLAGDLARTLGREGHDVKLCVTNRDVSKCLDGFVQKTSAWRRELGWVGKDGLIIFDDCGFGSAQDELRKNGYQVVGGSRYADALELDREHAQEIFKQYGLKTVPLKDFKNAAAALAFVKQWRISWVIKQRHAIDKALTFVGKMYDGSDVVDILSSIAADPGRAGEQISLHKRIEGVEIGVGRYFNGTDWIGPIEFNVEHPRLFPGNIGPVTNELGTLAWYEKDETSRLYQETLARLKPYLQKIRFKGDFALNCIVNKDGAFILEATPRLGSPIIHLQSHLHDSPWGEFLLAVAKGGSYPLRWKKGYGIVVLVATPPFPYEAKRVLETSVGIHFVLKSLSEKEMRSIHFEGVALKDGKKGYYCIADPHGYILYVTGVESSIAKARTKVYEIIEKINIPNMMYRNDIGLDFMLRQRQQLEEWGYWKSKKERIPLRITARSVSRVKK